MLRKLIFVLLLAGSSVFAGENYFPKLQFMLGSWQGTGSGFGNTSSVIESEFIAVMGGKYIRVENNSRFEPTEKNPEGENHIDWGMISFDLARKMIVYRQFNNEGYVNQYILIDSLSNDSTVVFETEIIENFVPGGKARFTINKIDRNEIETVFDVSFPGKEFACFGTNRLKRK